MSHLPKSFVPALPLAREGQELLVRFLAGRDSAPDGLGQWDGAFAAVAALKQPAPSKE